MAEPGPGVELRACPPRGRIELRGDPGDPGLTAAVAEAVGLEPPRTPHTGRSHADTVILWLGPDAWLIEVPAEVEDEVAGELEKSLSECHASVAIVGDAYVTLSLSGPRATDVLAKGMTLDLSPDRFPAGACARSLLAKVPVMLRRRGDAPEYEVSVPRSYAEFARDWLEDAALEYAVTGDSP